MFFELIWSHRDLVRAASLAGLGVMAKNRAWKVLGHLMEILTLCPNKIFLWISWLEIWWDVAKHPNTLFRKVWCSWECWLAVKWLEPQNNPKIWGFCPLGPPSKVNVILFITIANLRSSHTFCKQKDFFQRVWFRLCSLLNGRS